MKNPRMWWTCATVVALAALTACGGGGGRGYLPLPSTAGATPGPSSAGTAAPEPRPDATPEPTPPAASHKISGKVGGLPALGLVLQINGGEEAKVLPDGGFAFSTALPENASYTVTVKQQPIDARYRCTVGQASGTVSAGLDLGVVCAVPMPKFAHWHVVDTSQVFPNSRTVLEAHAVDPASGAIAAAGSASAEVSVSNASAYESGTFEFHPSGRFAYRIRTTAIATSIDQYTVKADGSMALGTSIALPAASLSPNSANFERTLVIDLAGRFVYLIGVGAGLQGAVSVPVQAFKVDPETGALAWVNGTTPSVAVWDWAKEPGGRFAYARADNSTLVFALDAETGLPTLSATLPVAYDTLRMAFHPNGKLVYARPYSAGGAASAYQEAYSLDPDSGRLTALGYQLPDNNAQALLMHPSGRFGYASESNGVQRYAVDAKSGQLTPAGAPVAIAGAPKLGPSGTVLYGIDSGATGGTPHVAVYGIDPTSGALTAGASTDLAAPISEANNEGFAGLIDWAF